MSEPENQNPEQSPLPLDYRVPPDQRLRQAPARRMAAVAGFFLGSAIVFALGLNFFDITPRLPAGDWRVPTAFFAGAGFCVIGAIWILYRNRRIREAFFGGVLIGAALMGLMEGVCFSGR